MTSDSAFWILCIIGFALAVGAFYYRDWKEPGFWRKRDR